MSTAPMFTKSKAIEFTVYGKPRPQGSTRAFTPKGWTRPVITTDNAQLKPWRQQITATAMSLGSAMFPRERAIEVTLRFYFTRPKSSKRSAVTVKPDLDKLARSALDSLTGVVFEDDSQVIEMHCRKMYGGPERVEIRVEEAIV